MESGRSTPTAMSRPSSKHARSVSGESTIPAASTRPPEALPAITTAPSALPRLTSAIPRPAYVQHTNRATTDTSGCIANMNQHCILQSILENPASSFAIVQGSLLTAIGLSWAVYSRIFRSNMDMWTAKLGCKEANTKKDELSDFANGRRETSSLPANWQPRLHILPEVNESNSATPSIEVQNSIETEASGHRPEMQEIKQSASNRPDEKSKTEMLLQKHIAYLEPWISRQPLPPEETQAEPSKIEGELCRMSLPAFEDLSTAIYQDVRRREQDSSPLSPNASPPLGWDSDSSPKGRKSVERMVLCRTINEQYLRLVLALVLEIGRRIAEMRIRGRREKVIEFWPAI